MQFYRIECVNKSYNPEEDNKKYDANEALKIKTITSDFNRKNGESAYFFAVDMSGEIFRFAAIVIDKKKLDKLIIEFFTKMKINEENYKIEEIVFKELRSFLRNAERKQYIYDIDEVIYNYELGVLEEHWHGFEFGENILEELNEDEIHFAVSESFSEETLAPEIDRIFTGCNLKTATGHPVHYMIETDDRDIRKNFYRLLLSALYKNKRIIGKRYCYLDVKEGREISRDSLEALFKSCIGGSVIVRILADDEEDDEYASANRDNIELICEIMQKYRNGVLTVLCVPRECSKMKEFFYEKMGNLGIIEIREDIASAKKAKEYLKIIGKKSGIRPDKKLLINNVKGYDHVITFIKIKILFSCSVS